VGEKARRFLEGRMLGLVDRRTTTDKGQRRLLNEFWVTFKQLAEVRIVWFLLRLI
jgi:hypothetical protein